MKNTMPYVPKVRDLDPVIGGKTASPGASAVSAADEEPRTNFTTRIPVSLRRRFKAACVECGVSMEATVAEALSSWIDGDHQ